MLVVAEATVALVSDFVGVPEREAGLVFSFEWRSEVDDILSLDLLEALESTFGWFFDSA